MPHRWLRQDGSAHSKLSEGLSMPATALGCGHGSLAPAVALRVVVVMQVVLPQLLEK